MLQITILSHRTEVIGAFGHNGSHYIKGKFGLGDTISWGWNTLNITSTASTVAARVVFGNVLGNGLLNELFRTSIIVSVPAAVTSVVMVMAVVTMGVVRVGLVGRARG